MSRLARTFPWLVAVLVLMALLAPRVSAEIVRDARGHLLGVTPHLGIAPTALPGALAATRAVGAARSSAALAGTPTGTLTYHGGNVMHSSAPYLIFWTPSGESIPSSTQSLLERYFSDAAAASGSARNVYAVARQYTDGSGFADYSQSFAASSQAITDTGAYPQQDAPNCPTVSGFSTCITDSQLETEISREIAAGGLPTDGSTGASTFPQNAPIYFVVLPTDVNLCYTANGGISCAHNGFCAYHSSYTSQGANVLYAAVPTVVLGPGQNAKSCQWDSSPSWPVQEPNGTPADVVLKYVSHEHNEVLTDPTGYGWYENSLMSNENGDECNAYGSTSPLSGFTPNAFAPVLGGTASAGTLYDQLINGDRYYLQSEWSNGDGACQLQPSSGSIRPQMTLSPSAPVAVGSSVSFDPSASSATNGYSSATWNFGDGRGTRFNSHSLAMSPVTHAYAATGTYNATLTLVDDRGNLATTTQSIAVYSRPTPAFSTITPMPYVGGSVGFDASASSDPDAGVTITSFAWTFGDGSSNTTSSPTTAHTYTAPGTYTVSLTVINSVGLASTVSRKVTVDELPSPVFTPTPSSPLAGQTVSFNGSGSNDPDGSVVNYSWDFGDGSTSAAAAATVTHTYTQAGIYQITLTVNDSDGRSNTSTQQLIVGSPPSASFAVASPANPVQGNPVNLDGSASSDPDPGVSISSYNWNFGDGNAATTATPTTSHTWAQPGTYTVSLTTTNTLGLSTTVSQAVVVDELPSAVSTPAPLSPAVGQKVTFNGAGSTDTDGSIVKYSWDFGDGTTSAGTPAAVSHIYAQAGIYLVALTVTDSDGHTQTATQQLTVGSPPSAQFQVTSPASPVQGSPVNFDASASSDSDPGVTITSYNWNFGDGNSATTTTPTISHTYGQPGSYNVTLSVTNSLGLTSTVPTSTVTVDELPTVAFTPSPVSPTPGSVVSFDASASSDPDGSIVTYSWNFGDNTGTYVRNTPAATHTYSGPGLYTVGLTISDASGDSATLSRQVIVHSLPAAAFSTTASRPVAASLLGFDATSSSDPNGASITTYSWNFGDGQTYSSASPVTSHSYAHAGVYTAALTITDSLGLSATSAANITIYALPTASFVSSPQTPVDGAAVSFNAGVSSDPNRAALTTYRWDFGDGTVTTAPGPNTNHAYAAPGTYTATLTIIDALGLTATTWRSVSVADEAPAAAPQVLTLLPVSGQRVSFTSTGSQDPDGALAAYAWNFGDGSADGWGPSPTHAYAAPGTYTVTLIVSDSSGARASSSTQVTIAAAGHITAMKVQASPSGPLLLITVSSAGRLRFGAKTTLVRRAGTVRLHLRLTRAQLRALAARGVLKVHSAVAFTPLVGRASDQPLTIVFHAVREHGPRKVSPFAANLLHH